MASSVEHLKYHLVWATKYRYKLLSKEHARFLKDYILKKQTQFGYKVVSLVIEPDHVHLLMEVKDSGLCLNSIIRKVKGGSSLVLRNRFRNLMRYKSLWTSSHFCSSTGKVSRKTVREYVNSQGIREEELIQRTNVYKILPSKCKSKKLLGYMRGVKDNDPTLAPAAMIQNADRVSEGQLPLRNDTIKYSSNETKVCKNWLRISGGRKCGTKPFWIGLLGRSIPNDAKICDSHIALVEGEFVVRLVYEQKRIIDRFKSGQDRVGLDLGVSHPVASVAIRGGKNKRVAFYGKNLKDQIFRRRKYCEYLQSLSNRHGFEIDYRDRLKKYGNRVNDTIHKLTSSIVKEGLPIVVGNIRNINRKWRRGNSSETLRKQVMNIPYGKISDQLFYKGILAGLPVAFVDEYNTSITCSDCGHKSKQSRKGQLFHCRGCGSKKQADANGAMNIMGMALGNLLGVDDNACERKLRGQTERKVPISTRRKKGM